MLSALSVLNPTNNKKSLFYGGLNVSYLISIVINHQKDYFYEEFVFDKRCATMIVTYFLKKQNAI